MKIADALQGVARLFLDTAPVIYYVENNPHYFTIVEVVFDHIDNGSVIAVTSPVTLAESLVVPSRLKRHYTSDDVTSVSDAYDAGRRAYRW